MKVMVKVKYESNGDKNRNKKSVGGFKEYESMKVMVKVKYESNGDKNRNLSRN